MKILITGGCGFVGSNLAVKLKTAFKKVEILALDNFYRKGSLINKKRLIDHNVKVIKADVRNFKDLDKVPKFDLLIDCAADPSALSGVKNGLEYLFETNLNGTLNSLKLIKKFNAKLIFLSSSRVYPFNAINDIKYTVKNNSFKVADKNIKGMHHKYGVSEKFDLDGLKTFYGYTKFGAENIIKEYCAAFDLKYIINRSGVIAGPWQWGKVDQGFIVYWLLCYFFNKKISFIFYKGKGYQLRDILNIDDLFKLIFLQVIDFKKFENDIFNIGGSHKNSLSLYNLTNICDDFFRINKKINIDKTQRYGDIPYYVSDISKINKLSGWKPIVSHHRTVEEIYSWMRLNLNTMKKFI